MDRAVLVDVREEGADAAGAGLEALVAEERVEPDEAAAGAVEAVGLGLQARLGIAVEAVGDEEDDGAAAEDAARSGAVEVVEAGAEARPPRPVGHRAAAAGERLVRVATP
jgi:hypothetical protein